MTSASDWSGAVGGVWADEWRRTDRSFAALSAHLDAAILAAAPAGSFRALDVGCGAGGTTLALAAARPDAHILGVDLSADLVAVARRRLARAVARPAARRMQAIPDDRGIGAGPAPVVFAVADAPRTAAAHGPFDLIYSRHGVMFFDDPVAAFVALRAAAAPGARLVFSCFRGWSDNRFASELAHAAGGRPPQPGPGPFAFADRDRVAHLLAASGWADASAEAVDFPYRAGGGRDPLGDALAFVRRIGPTAAMLRAAPPGDRPALVAALRDALARRHVDGAVDFPAAAWIWSATAQAGECA